MRAPVSDDIYVKVIKLMGVQRDKALELFTALFNATYFSGKIPADWLKVTFMTISKKTHSRYGKKNYSQKGSKL